MSQQSGGSTRVTIDASFRYLCVYKANVPRPSEDCLLAKRDDWELWIHPGPMGFSVSEIITVYEPPSAGATLVRREIQLPDGCYFVICAYKTIRQGDPHLASQDAAMQVSELVSLLDLRHPGIVAEKAFEGVISPPGSLIWMPEGPLNITAHPITEHKTLATEVLADLALMDSLTVDMRRRYQLASRWFRRGNEAANPVDKFLSWWIVLEVHPGRGRTNIVNSIAELIRRGLYPALDSIEVKSRIEIGRIYGLRSEIVHEGRAFASLTDGEFFAHLEKLRAISLTCLRLLLRIEPGKELDRYVVREN